MGWTYTRKGGASLDVAYSRLRPDTPVPWVVLSAPGLFNSVLRWGFLEVRAVDEIQEHRRSQPSGKPEKKVPGGFQASPPRTISDWIHCWLQRSSKPARDEREETVSVMSIRIFPGTEVRQHTCSIRHIV